ncbi:MAG: phosphotransferase family protein [Chloroflexota bacterium]
MTSERGSDTLLTDRASVEAFWRRDLGRPEELRHVEFLTGGVSSIVIRVTTDADSFVIKQALPQLRVEAAWYARPERSLIEARCATVLSDLVPGAVPEVIATVPSRNAFVMRSAPAGTETWKVRLMRGDVSIAVAAAVGRLLGRIHAGSAVRSDISRDFADRSFFDELRIDPYLRYVGARTPALAPALGDVADVLLTTGACLVHGDFSPKNLLVTPDSCLLLVDHEVAHWGHPAFDVGFVVSHLCLKAIRFRGAGDAGVYLDAAAAVLAPYAEEVGDLRIGLGQFATRVTGALLLARVDGKSPAEYLTDERDRATARALGRDALLDPPPDQRALVERVRTVLAGA